MMRILLLVFLLFFGFRSVQPENVPEIMVPQDGQVLQGVVSISGSTRMPGFQLAEIAFSYDTDSASDWFLLHEDLQPVERGEITEWDTTTLTDGNYRLRLRVTLEDGEILETLVKGLRVRNYWPIETQTPEPVVIVIEPTATVLVPTRTAVLSPTPLPPNPALVTHENLRTSLVQGIVITLAVFGVFGSYLALKRLIQRS
jgi:hypothetical protein